MRIDPRSTFRMVIAGSSNEHALALVRRAVGRTATRPNPVLIYGASGVGKTMILHAAANALARQLGPITLQAWTAEEFSNAYVHAIRSGTMRNFRTDLTRADAFVVDGLEDAAKQPSTLQELLRAVATLVERHKPVLLASGPAGVGELAAHVCSLPLGVAAVIRPPTLSQRVTALQRVCTIRHRSIAHSRLTRIARQESTIPAAKGALERMVAELNVASASEQRPSLRRG